ncbi:MAG: CvpA family protein [Chitinispirillaceae bacterium]|nr:CvpA family protein [Chitinispirillaceae bacterium]
MHAFDILLAIIAAVFIFTGIRRGLIGEVIRLAAMIAGCIVAFLYYHRLSAIAPISKLPLQLHIKNGVSFILIYIACAAGIITIGWFIKKVVHLTPLGLVDRLAGGIIGLLKVLLIAYVACLSIASLPLKRIRTDFRHSIVFRTYTALPDSFSLKSLLQKKSKVTTIFGGGSLSSPNKEIKEAKKKFDTFKAVVDSAKKARDKSRKNK